MTVDVRLMSGSIDLAWAAVEASRVPEQAREAAFRETLRALLSQISYAEFRNSDLGRSKESDSGRGGDFHPGLGEEKMSDIDLEGGLAAIDESAAFARLSVETGVAREVLEAVVNIDEGVVKIIAPQSRLGSSTADKARTVAQIVTIVRQIGLGDKDVTFALLRSACESKHCYDSKNFATEHMSKITGFVVRGEGKNRRLEARGAGIEAFSTLMRKVSEI